MTDLIVVWHRDDLRTADNAALAAAARGGTPCPVFVADPAFYDDRGLACDARIEFLFECLADLREQYRDLGSDLAILHGNSVERLRDLLGAGRRGSPDTAGASADRTRLYFNRGVPTADGLARDEAILGWRGVEAFGEDGIVRDGESRDGWSDQCEAYFEGEQHPTPGSLSENPIPSDCTLDDLRAEYGVDSEKERVPRGGRTPGLRRLDRFVDTIHEYPSAVSRPATAERHCSRLSAYIKFGALSIREVYQRVRREAVDGRGREMFTSRLFWNRHYRQKLADWPEATERSINPVFRSLHRRDHDPDLVSAWREGRTGFPMVDAAMRALVETGFINFRMRSLVATFYSYVLREWWKPGADFLYSHLIDADPGINYEQWQAQAGLVGVHPIRVYDPAKQAREYDAEGAFVRRYVPELAPLPDEHLPRPEKTPLAVQEECGVEIGEDYPYPVVDYERRANEARDLMARHHDRAQETLYADPELLRRASLSSRRQQPNDDAESVRSDQTSLEEF
jgi:deoxyribodipyrimidine photo-lyase